MAGAEGIEPSSAVLETDILPLNYAPEMTIFFYPLVNRTPPHSLQQDSIRLQKIK